MNLFAYGSLMFPVIWERVAGDRFPTAVARLDGFAAWKVRGEAYPGLAPAADQTTEGLVYIGVTHDAVARLDAFEGPFYQRELVDVRLADDTLMPAFSYIVSPAHRHTLEPVRWDADDFRRRHLHDFLGPQHPEGRSLDPAS